MLTNTERKIFNQFFLFVSGLFLFVSAIAAPSRQEVYFSPKPLPMIVKKLKKKGMSQEEITHYLKGSLIRVTPEFAREKFNIDWLDSDLPDYIIALSKLGYKKAFGHEIQVYPPVVICYMGPRVGYGLFALQDIPSGSVISQYTGRVISENVNEESFEYRAGLRNGYDVDSSHSGNAARFTSGLFGDNVNLVELFGPEGLALKFLLDHKKDLIQQANSYLDTIVDHYPAILLVVRENIGAFEQIVINYGGDYWRLWKKKYPSETPCLFAKNGRALSIADSVNTLLFFAGAGGDFETANFFFCFMKSKNLANDDTYRNFAFAAANTGHLEIRDKVIREAREKGFNIVIAARAGSLGGGVGVGAGAAVAEDQTKSAGGGSSEEKDGSEKDGGNGPDDKGDDVSRADVFSRDGKMDKEKPVVIESTNAEPLEIDGLDGNQPVDDSYALHKLMMEIMGRNVESADDEEKLNELRRKAEALFKSPKISVANQDYILELLDKREERARVKIEDYSRLFFDQENHVFDNNGLNSFNLAANSRFADLPVASHSFNAIWQ